MYSTKSNRASLSWCFTTQIIWLQIYRPRDYFKISMNIFLMFDGHGQVFDVIICWVGALHINIWPSYFRYFCFVHLKFETMMYFSEIFYLQKINIDSFSYGLFLHYTKNIIMVSTNEPYSIFFVWCPPHGLLVFKMAYLGSLYGQSTFNNHLNTHYPYHCPLETYFPSLVLWFKWPTNGESQLFIPKIHFKPHKHIKK